jgi:hypothetical protein
MRHAMDKKEHHYTNRVHDVNKTPRFCTTMPLRAASGKGSTLTIPAVTREFDTRRMRGLIEAWGNAPAIGKKLWERNCGHPHLGNWNCGHPHLVGGIVDTHIWELGELWVSQVHLRWVSQVYLRWVSQVHLRWVSQVHLRWVSQVHLRGMHGG